MLPKKTKTVFLPIFVKDQTNSIFVRFSGPNGLNNGR